ncbi:MAG: hypothetical protein HZC42_06565 [Candidatus Eisenbacteria bacterium]|nr:hypothetical protein [Candidatus Eisenbacteria bacterium]
MPPTLVPSTDPDLRAALQLGLDAVPDAGALPAARHVAAAFGPATAALVHYGSWAQQLAPPAGSARDFFVIVDGYGAAYRALAAGRRLRRPPGLATFLNRVLPPNVLSLEVPGGSRPRLAKCAVLSLRDLRAACGPRPRDQWVRGRLFQQVQLVWARDPQSREAVLEALREARARTFEWGRTFLPAFFDADAYAHALLRASYAGEIRPEEPGHVAALVTAQRGTLLPVCEALLGHLARHGVLAREGNRFRQRRPPSTLRRLVARLWFAGSKLRATLRWAKYVALYDGWLDYVVNKVERRSGVVIELTPRERRWPLLFLWPKALRFLASRPRRRR